MKNLTSRRPPPPLWIVWTFVVVVATQVPLASNAYAAAPRYLADMPTVEQVIETISGDGPLDTAIRQASALEQLCRLIRAMSEGGQFRSKETPEESAQCALYTAATGPIWKRVDDLSQGLPKYGPESRAMRVMHYHDDAFGPAVLHHFPKLWADCTAHRVVALFSDASKSNSGRSGSTAFASLMTGLLALVFLASGVALFVTVARIHRRHQAGSTREKIIFRTLEGSSSDIVPRGPGLVIEHLCIGAIDVPFSTVDPVTVRVSGDTATVSGGGKRWSSYMVYDFGCSLHNPTPNAVRFQMTITPLDRQGYGGESRPVWADVAPGEKRRIWAGLALRENSDFASYRLEELGFAPTPVDRQATADFTAKTSPKQSLLQVFGLAQSPLPRTSLTAWEAVTALSFSMTAVVCILMAVLSAMVASFSLYR